MKEHSADLGFEHLAWKSSSGARERKKEEKKKEGRDSSRPIWSVIFSPLG